MKKYLLSLLSLIFVCQLSAQLVTTSPGIVIQQTGSGVTITFDDSYVTALNGNAGPLYVHTGVITSASTSNSDWKNVITPWPSTSNLALANTTANKLTQVGSTTKWTLTISDINVYYGLTVGTIVTQLAFVVRTADGSLQSSNIYIPVYQPGLNVKVTAPTTNSLVTQGTATTLTAIASNGTNSCNISLFVGSTSTSNITGTTPVISGTGVNTLTTTYTFNTTGSYYIIAQAVSNGSTKNDTAYVCVPITEPTGARPTGLKEGVTINGDGTVTFCLSLARGLPVTTATQVYLLGDFNNFRLDNNYMMTYQGESATYSLNTNFYWITLSGLNPSKEYAYQYYVTGLSGTSDVKIGDPYCEKILDPSNDQYINQTSTIYPNLRAYPSTQATDILSCFQINPTKYTWQYSSSFTPPAQNKLMIYEMLFRDFTTQGSVQAAIQKLDYIKTLGVNAVELMPIMEFDGNNSWGYNPNFFFATDKAYGTKIDYQQFIDECHKRGLAVILDIVFNHTWGLSPYCRVYWDSTNGRPLSTNPYYNAVAPHPYSVGNDLRHDRTVVRSWLKRALAFWLTEYKVDGFRFDLSKGFTQTSSTTATVSNYDATRVGYIEEYVAAIKAVNSNAYSILEHFCDQSEEDVLAAYQNTMLWRNKAYSFQQAAMGYATGSDLSTLNGTNRVGYAESHDEERMGFKALSYGQPLVMQDTASVLKQLAVCAAFMALNPGPRMMWQFGELGYTYSLVYNGGNTAPKPVRWDWLNNADRMALYNTYSKILNFRKVYSDLFASPTSWNWQVAESDWSNGRRIYLTNGTITAIVLGNFTGTGSVTVTPGFSSTGNWYELISGTTLNVSNTSMTLSLPIYGLQIYTNQPLTLSNKIVTNDNAQVYPNPVEDNLYISGAEATSIEVTSLSGVTLVHKSIENNTVSLVVLPTGVYIGKITFTDGSTKVVKVCKR
jgi:1,4-alpha-glucan branching enzyme